MNEPQESILELVKQHGRIKKRVIIHTLQIKHPPSLIIHTIKQMNKQKQIFIDRKSGAIEIPVLNEVEK